MQSGINLPCSSVHEQPIFRHWFLLHFWSGELTCEFFEYVSGGVAHSLVTLGIFHSLQGQISLRKRLQIRNPILQTRAQPVCVQEFRIDGEEKWYPLLRSTRKFGGGRVLFWFSLQFLSRMSHKHGTRSLVFCSHFSRARVLLVGLKTNFHSPQRTNFRGWTQPHCDTCDPRPRRKVSQTTEKRQTHPISELFVPMLILKQTHKQREYSCLVVVRDVHNVFVLNSSDEFDDGRVCHQTIVLHYVLRQLPRDVSWNKTCKARVKCTMLSFGKHARRKLWQ